MVVESKIMKRWEFESANQASEFIDSWFSGNKTERRLLQNYLNCISSKGKSMNYYPLFLYGFYFYYPSHLYSYCAGDEFHDAQDFLTSEWDSENLMSDNDDSGYVQHIRESSDSTGSSYTQPPCSGPYKKRKIIKLDAGSCMSEESYSEIVTSPRYSSSCSSCGSDHESDQQQLEPCTYKDVLICFRFNDHDLRSD